MNHEICGKMDRTEKFTLNEATQSQKDTNASSISHEDP